MSHRLIKADSQPAARPLKIVVPALRQSAALMVLPTWVNVDSGQVLGG